MFKFKTIPKHSFIDDSPFWYVSQREWGYVDELTGQINIPYDTPCDVDFTTTITDTLTYQGVTVTNGQGGVIFEANENQITWNGSDLMTEERVREIFRGEIEEVLRRSGIEVT
ncbi:hypothetical protein N9966_00865 [bacterium]|nr:hypothetical protein [bacterium]